MSWDNILPIVYAGLLLVFLYVPIKQTLHMFQQNRYELVRFIPWIKQNVLFNVKVILGRILPFVLFVGVFFISNRTYQWLLMIGLLISIGLPFHLMEHNKKYVKPLDITHRVMRQMAVFYMLWILLFFILITVNVFEVWIVVSVLLLPLSWTFVIVVALITEPIEEGVKRGYIHLAKRNLNKQVNLIKIGITGSYGKTTTKHIVNDILSTEYYCLMTPSSFNTPMGITITIRNYLKPLHQVFICEMGADKVNEIQYLSSIVNPQFGVVTAVGPQHLNTFKTVDNITKEKMKLIENLPLSGVGVINLDNEHIRNYHIRNKCLVLTVGIYSDDVDYKATNIEYTTEGSFFEILTKDNVRIPFKSRLLGEHNVLNILISVALGKQLGIEWKQLQQSVNSLRQVKNRLEPKTMLGFHVIDNSFNSNPISANNSIKVLSMMPNKRIMITPGMIELGELQHYHNKEFGKNMKGHVDAVILIGKRQTQPIHEGLEETGYNMNQVYVVNSMVEAFDVVKAIATTEDTILIENDLPDAFIH
jgi:UDP-N-acetylmuramoyl-tripeptide--D-alanyl-D-alanine ligase